MAKLAAGAGHEVVGTATTSAGGWAPLDITSREAVHRLVAEVRPQLVVNTAYRASSWAACADGAANVALAAAAVGSRLVHLSTDALHAGCEHPYPDDIAPTPVHAYGAAKAAAETAVSAITPDAAIVRTSLILGDDRSAQIQLILDFASGRKKGALFSDEYRCPVDVQDLAAAVLELAADGYAGLINVAGPEALSRVSLGRLVARAYGLDPSSLPTSTIAEGGLGPRPANVRLDSSRAEALLTTRLRPASECIRPGIL